MSVVDLINYLRLEGPHGLESVPTTSEEDAPPLGNELTNEKGDLEGVEDNPVETDLGVKDDPMGDASAEEPMEEETLRKIPRRNLRRTQVSENRWKRRILRRILKGALRKILK